MMPRDVGRAYGPWIASLAPWRIFATGTHARPVGWMGYDRVGIGRHRDNVRDWFYEVVRWVDPGAQWWSETELHASGAPHEHGLLASDMDFSALEFCRNWWRWMHGDLAKEQGMDFRTITYGSWEAVASYVAKYSGKAAAYEPSIYGFGLLSRPSFARALGYPNR